jgi:hypothetical protein
MESEILQGFYTMKNILLTVAEVHRKCGRRLEFLFYRHLTHDLCR